MRLTLRTLLAWMDGVLPPEEARQLGEKIDSSPVARDLVARIRAVVANPQLAAPRVEGRGIGGDPDSVAEYLDNTLPADRLESFERICLESDMHLAEVAACHELLAEIAKNPAILPPLDAAHRRRLLESLRHRTLASPHATAPAAKPATPVLRGEEAARAASSGAARTTTASATVNAPLAPPTPPPNPARRVPWTAWALAATSLTLLAVLAAIFAQSLGLFRGGSRSVEVAKAPVERAAAEARPEAAPGPDAGDGAAASEIDEPLQTVADGRPSADAGEGVADAGVDAPAGAPAGGRGLADLLDQADAGVDTPPADGQAPADEATLAPAGDGTESSTEQDGDVEVVVDQPAPPVAAQADAQGGPRRVPAGEALAIGAGVRPARAPKEVAAKGPAAASGNTPSDAADGIGADVGLEGAGGARAASLGFVAADGAPLRRVADGDRISFMPIGVGTALDLREELVVPTGMQPELNLGGVSVRVLPRSIVRLSAGDDGTPRVEVILGRIVARAGRPDGRIGLAAGALAGTVTAGLDGAVAVEASHDWHPGLEGETVPLRGTLLAVGRPVRFLPAGGPDAGAASDVVLAERTGLVVSEGAIEELSAARLPPWTIGAERLDPLDRGAAEAYAAKLAALPEGSDPAAGLEQVLLAMAIDRRVENRVFAATAFALIGNYDLAAEMLCSEAPARKLEARQWRTLEAATVPLALSRGPESASRLRKAWEDRGPPGKAELLMKLARGATDAELAAGADRTLVETLAAPELVLRRYALENLNGIVEPSAFDRSRFRPDGPEEGRRDGAGWWRTQVEKGLVRRAR